MVTWQGKSPRSWPHGQPRSSAPAGEITREQDLDVSKALRDTGDLIEQAEAVLAPDEPGARHGAADRLLADRLLVEAVLEEGLSGPRHRMLEETLVRYAVPVLQHDLATGQIVSKATRLGIPLSGSVAWAEFTQADREDFAAEMVAAALPRFTRAVFEEGVWSASKGASLKTFFVNTCVLQFPAPYRKWREQRRAARPVGLEVGRVGEDPAVDPAITVAAQDEAIRTLMKIHGRQTQEIFVLRAAGYTNGEAARQVGLTPKAAEGRTTRARKDLKNERDSTEPPNSKRPGTTQGGRWGQ